MTKKLTILIAVVLILSSVNLMTEPCSRGRDMMRHARYGIYMAEKNLFPGHMLLKFKEEIELTAEQVNKIEKMAEFFEEVKIKRQADIKIKGLKVRSFLREDQVDRKELEKMLRDFAKIKTDLEIDHMNYLLDLKDLLTAEQMDKIESLKKEKRHKTMKKRKFLKEDRH